MCEPNRDNNASTFQGVFNMNADLVRWYINDKGIKVQESICQLQKIQNYVTDLKLLNRHTSRHSCEYISSSWYNENSSTEIFLKEILKEKVFASLFYW